MTEDTCSRITGVTDENAWRKRLEWYENKCTGRSDYPLPPSGENNYPTNKEDFQAYENIWNNHLTYTEQSLWNEPDAVYKRDVLKCNLPYQGDNFRKYKNTFMQNRKLCPNLPHPFDVRNKKVEFDWINTQEYGPETQEQLVDYTKWYNKHWITYLWGGNYKSPESYSKKISSSNGNPIPEKVLSPVSTAAATATEATTTAAVSSNQSRMPSPRPFIASLYDMCNIGGEEDNMCFQYETYFRPTERDLGDTLSLPMALPNTITTEETWSNNQGDEIGLILSDEIPNDKPQNNTFTAFVGPLTAPVDTVPMALPSTITTEETWSNIQGDEIGLIFSDEIPNDKPQNNTFTAFVGPLTAPVDTVELANLCASVDELETSDFAYSENVSSFVSLTTRPEVCVDNSLSLVINPSTELSEIAGKDGGGKWWWQKWADVYEQGQRDFVRKGVLSPAPRPLQAMPDDFLAFHAGIDLVSSVLLHLLVGIWNKSVVSGGVFIGSLVHIGYRVGMYVMNMMWSGIVHAAILAMQEGNKVLVESIAQAGLFSTFCSSPLATVQYYLTILPAELVQKLGHVMQKMFFGESHPIIRRVLTEFAYFGTSVFSVMLLGIGAIFIPLVFAIKQNYFSRAWLNKFVMSFYTNMFISNCLDFLVFPWMHAADVSLKEAWVSGSWSDIATYSAFIIVLQLITKAVTGCVLWMFSWIVSTVYQKTQPLLQRTFQNIKHYSKTAWRWGKRMVSKITLKKQAQEVLEKAQDMANAAPSSPDADGEEDEGNGYESAEEYKMDDVVEDVVEDVNIAETLNNLSKSINQADVLIAQERKRALILTHPKIREDKTYFLIIKDGKDFIFHVHFQPGETEDMKKILTEIQTSLEHDPEKTKSLYEKKELDVWVNKINETYQPTRFMSKVLKNDAIVFVYVEPIPEEPKLTKPRKPKRRNTPRYSSEEEASSSTEKKAEKKTSSSTEKKAEKKTSSSTEKKTSSSSQTSSSSNDTSSPFLLSQQVRSLSPDVTLSYKPPIQTPPSSSEIDFYAKRPLRTRGGTPVRQRPEQLPEQERPTPPLEQIQAKCKKIQTDIETLVRHLQRKK